MAAPSFARFLDEEDRATAKSDAVAGGEDPAYQPGPPGEKDEEFASRVSGVPFTGYAKPRRGHIVPSPAGHLPAAPSFAEFLSDPLNRQPERPEDLPSQAEFDAAHQKHVAQFRDQVTRPGIGPAPAPGILERIKGVVMGTPETGTTAIGRAAGLNYDAPTEDRPSDQLLHPEALLPGEPKSVAAGVGKGALELAGGMTTPANALMLAGSGGLGALGEINSLLPRAVSAGFSLDMLKGAYDQYPDVRDAIDRKDWPRAAQAITKLAGTVGMATLAGKHAVGAEPVGSSPLGKPEGPKTRLSSLESAVRSAESGMATLTDHPSGGRDAAGAGPDVSRGTGMSSSAPSFSDFLADENKSAAPVLLDRADTLRPEVAAKLPPGAVRVNPDGTREVLREVPVDQIRPAQPTEDRPQGNEIYPDVVRRYVQAAMPVELRETPEGFDTHEGHHRIEAAKARGDEVVRAWTKLDQSEAQAESERPGTKTLETNQGGEDQPSAVTPQNAGPETAPSFSDFLARQSSDRAASEPSGEPLPYREPAKPPAVGRDIKIAVSGEDTIYPARYAIREAADVQPSHNAFSFEPNPKYEHTNDRDYSQTGNAARVVEQANKFNPEFLTTEAPTAEHGPTIVDANGNAIGGNSRAMSLARVYQKGGEAADAYRNALRDKAGQYGIDPKELDRFDYPVLVRELPGGIDAQKAITDFNKTAAADLTPEERAVADGRRLSNKTVQEIAGRLGDLGESGTMAEALRGEDGAAVINSLVGDGLITPQEKGGYIDDRGHLTPEAKSRIAKSLVGRLFNTPAEFRETKPEMRNKLERIAPQVLRVEGRPDWSLTDKVREAVSMIEDARVHRMKLDDLAGQEAMGGRRYSPEAIEIAKTLSLAPTKAEAAFRRYANDEGLSREGAQSAFFEPPSRQDAFREAFGSSDRGSPFLGGLRELALNTRGGVDPNTATFGARQFAERDLKPAAMKIAAALSEAKDQALRLIAPDLRGDSAELMGLTLRQRMAQFARRYDQARARLRDAWNFFDRRTPEQNYSFMDDVERGLGRGKTPGNANLEPIARTLARTLDQRRREVQGLGEGALERFYQNYFPHMFERPENVPAFVESFFRGKQSMEGSKSFLKQRDFPTMKEAREAGLKPISDNPIDLVLAKVREMDRYLLAHHTLRDLAERGIAKRVSRSEADTGQLDLLEGAPLKKHWLVPTKEDLPAGFQSIRDAIGGGKWFADEGAAQVLNNYLTPGLRQKSGAYRIAMGLNNAMNQANLGLSAFHVTGEMIRSVMNRSALGLKDLFLGQPIRGSVRIVTAPAGPFIDYLQGAKGVREWFKPGSEGAPIAAIIDGLMKGGARANVEQDYVNNAAASMKRDARAGNYPGALARAVPAFFETTAKPLMQQFIPRIKMGAAMQMAEQELGRLPADASVDDVRQVMAKVWDSVDNRMGQMVYDNLFWNRTLRDLAHLSVRAVGWDLGTLREFGGGALDAAKLATGKKPVTYDRIAYAISAAFTTALAGAMYQYLHTGQGPQQVKDYFFPKREDGSRISMPTDIKDLYHYATAPLRTIENKASPLFNTTAELLHNRDFYNRPIREEGDPLYAQGKQVLDFLFRQTVPFTLQPAQGKKKFVETNPEHKVENFLGFTRASGDIQDNQKPRRGAKSPY